VARSRAPGVVQGLYLQYRPWWMGYQAGLRAFTAAVLGGIGNMPGAALGGFVIVHPLRLERPAHLRRDGPMANCFSV